jgi:hypothetical protein
MGIEDKGQGRGNIGQRIGDRDRRQGTVERGSRQGIVWAGDRGQGMGDRGKGTGNRGQRTEGKAQYRGQGTGSRGLGDGEQRTRGMGNSAWTRKQNVLHRKREIG